MYMKGIKRVFSLFLSIALVLSLFTGISLNVNAEEDSYTIKFDANGGSGTQEDLKISKDANSVTIPNCEFKREGYTFVGWKCDRVSSISSNYLIQPQEINPSIYSNFKSIIFGSSDTATFVAQWEDNSKEYTINFDANGGSGSQAPITGVTYSDLSTTVVPKCDFTRSGYTFDKWNTKADGTGTSYTANSLLSNYAKNYADESGNITLYAQWEDANRKFNVVFDGNGATSGTTASMNGLTSDQLNITMPQCGYKRDGYTFIGWTTSPVSLENYYGYIYSISPRSVYHLSSSDFYQSDTKTFYAVWWNNNDTFTINFDGNGADSGSMKSLTGLTLEQIQSGVVMPQCEYNKKDCSFVGWSRGGSSLYSPGSKLRLSFNDFANENRAITLYADWWNNNRTYKVNFDGNGDGVVGKMESIVYDDLPIDKLKYGLELPECAFSWEGHTFTGWKGFSSSRIYLSEFKRLFANTDEVTLYADWIDNSSRYPYTLIFDGNGATSGSMNSYDDFEVVPNGYLRLPNCQYQKNGYEFIGWSTMPNSNGAISYSEGDIYNSGVGSGSRSSMIYAPGSYVKINTNYYNNTSDKSITFYAIWAKSNEQKNEQKTYQIIYDGNGASGSMDTDYIMRNNDNRYYFQRCKYNKKGNIFIGWNTKADGTGVMLYPSDSMGDYWFSQLFSTNDKVTLYAQWDNNTDIYNIIYDGNGSTSGYTEPTKLTKTSVYKFPQCGYKKEGYYFIGWNTKPDGTGYYLRRTEYYHTAILGYDPDTFIGTDLFLWDFVLSAKPGDNTVYAIWAKDDGKRYSIIYNGNGADSGYMGKDTGITASFSYSIPDCSYNKKGYRFKNWNTRADGCGFSIRPETYIINGYAEVNSPLNVGENQLYAQWTKNEIEFDGTSSTSGSMQPLVIADDATTIMIPECSYKKDGCSFVSWNTKADGSGSTIRPGEFRLDSLDVIGWINSTPSGSALKLYPMWACDTEDIINCDESGHRWNDVQYTWNGTKCTATRICQNNPMHKETETVTATSRDTKAATCTETGTRKYTATFKNPAFSTQTKIASIPAKGHNWSAPTYKWSADGKTCTATRVCKNNPKHVEKEIATVGNKKVALKVTKNATCKTTGTRQYVATFSNKAFKKQVNSKKYNVAINKTAHKWGAVTYKWSADGKTCTATRVCANNKNHKQTETVKATATIAKKATATAMGQTKYTAKFKNAAFGTKIITKTNIKINQPMVVASKATSKQPAVIKFVNLRKKNQTIAAKNAFAVAKAQGKVTYKNLSGNANIIVASNGNIIIKKGLKRGIYAIKVRVAAAGSAKYKAGYKDVIVTVKVQ